MTEIHLKNYKSPDKRLLKSKKIVLNLADLCYSLLRGLPPRTAAKSKERIFFCFLFCLRKNSRELKNYTEVIFQLCVSAGSGAPLARSKTASPDSESSSE